MIPRADPSRWSEVHALFGELVDLEEPGRAERLAVIGESDPELRRSLEALLRGDAEASVRLARLEGLLSPRSREAGAPAGGVSDPLGLTGRTISHFRVLEPVAAGGMGIVYRAEDTLLGRPVALKLPLPERWFERDARERFIREGRAAGALDHPNVCAIHEVGETDDGLLYIAMAWYRGEPLSARLAREGPLAIPEALSIARAIARGLGAAHAAGIVHRDVKPANVMLLPDGGVKVLDFGLAKPPDVSLTGPRAMMGTVAYMAPEQIRGASADARVDLWALGVVLYEMLTGRRPFGGDRDISVAHAILHDEPIRPGVLRSEIPRSVEAVVCSLLEKEPERRPQTAALAEADLAAAEAGRSLESPALATRPTPAQPPLAQPRRLKTPSPRMLGLTAGLLLLGGAAAVVALRRPRDREKEFVVVADFETAPVDSQIADVLTDVTRRALSASRSLGAVPDTRMLAARQRLRVPAGARLSLPVARQIALGDGIRGVVAGSLKSFSGGYALSLRLLSAATGQVLATAEQPGIVSDQLYVALDTLTRRLRGKAGDDLEAIRAQPPILALTSTSLQAMTDYATALRLPRDSTARAVALLREAIVLDTSFASAYWQLSRLMELAGPTVEAEHRALLAKAWAHRDGLTEYEQLRLEIAYKYSPDGTTPDVERHIERLRAVVDQYPNAADAKMVGDLYLGKRDLVEAERMHRLAIDLDSTRVDAYLGLANTYFKAKRIREARRTVDVVARKFPGLVSSDAFDAVVSYAEGRPGRARDIMRRLAGSADNDRRVFAYIQLAQLDLLEGRVAAWENTMAAKDSLVGMRSSAPGLRTARLAAPYWVLQRPEQGLRMLDSSVAGTPALRLGLDVAELYAQLGTPESARAIMAARVPLQRSIYTQGTDTLPVYAWIDLAEGRPREAAAKFRGSLRFLGGSAPSQISRDAELGLAFERAGMADSAIASYEHYLNAAPGWELDALKLVWILEHAAPLYEQKGDRRKARAAYARIVELWSHADPELQPRVMHARERAAALR